MNINMRIYEIIQENLNNSEWRKHARDFIKLQTAENSTVRNSAVKNLTAESSIVENDDDEL